MEKTVSVILATLLNFMTAGAQIQVRSAPEHGYDLRIRYFVDQLRVVDTHEHLLNLAGLKKISTLDFTLLFAAAYAGSDISAAGMPSLTYRKLYTDSLTVMEKWKFMEPYWEGSSNTAYNRAILVAADKLYGIKNIDRSTIEELSEKIRKAYDHPEDWFNHVIKEKSGFDYIVEDWDWEDRIAGDPKIFRYTRRFDDFININSKKNIEKVIKWRDTGVNTLDDLVSALGSAFHAALSEGFVAVKTGLAYNRILFYENVKKEKANEVFNKIMDPSGKNIHSFDEVKPLQDYMMHRILDLAEANNIPVQIHTGFNGGTIGNSNPTHLTNLFREYPDIKFILFHGAYPFGGELATLAKHYRNVYIDMCWLYIVSPSYSERYLHEWLETVPANKIMAFGGDCRNVEGVYSHLFFARQIVSNVLIDKVKDGYFTEKEAMKVAEMVLHDNAIRILDLK